jgi:hypothetical protein
VSGFVASPTAENISGNVVFLNVINTTGSGASATYSYSSSVVAPGGTVLQALQANSAFASFGGTAVSSDALTSVIQVVGITDTNGGWGGATVNNVSVGTLSATPLTTGGSNYVMPANYEGLFEGFPGTSIAVGELEAPSNSAAPTIGEAVDLSKNFILPLGFSNTNVTLF